MVLMKGFWPILISTWWSLLCYTLLPCDASLWRSL